jgi:hypothetical protein
MGGVISTTNDPVDLFVFRVLRTEYDLLNPSEDKDTTQLLTEYDTLAQAAKNGNIVAIRSKIL